MADIEDDLVPGRECGPCTICCTALTVDTPELQKLPGVTCPNCAVGQGCTIYDVRPPVCRGWFCAWRQLPWIGGALRPSESGVLIYLTGENLPAGYAGDLGLEFSILTQDGLKAEGLADAICAAIGAGLAVFLAVPGHPGHVASRWLLNEDLNDLVARGQKAAILRDLKKLYIASQFMRASAAASPVVLTHGPK